MTHDGLPIGADGRCVDGKTSGTAPHSVGPALAPAEGPEEPAFLCARPEAWAPFREALDRALSTPAVRAYRASAWRQLTAVAS